MTAAAFERVELAVAIGPVGGIGVAPGVQLDAGGTELDRGLDLSGIGIDEESDLDARVAATRQRLGDAVALADHVEAPFGRQLFSALGHERRLVRA